jgi:hypothetical protein
LSRYADLFTSALLDELLEIADFIFDLSACCCYTILHLPLVLRGLHLRRKWGAASCPPLTSFLPLFCSFCDFVHLKRSSDEKSFPGKPKTLPGHGGKRKNVLQELRIRTGRRQVLRQVRTADI